MQHPDELQLQSYLDGELTEATRRRVEAHLSACGACREALRSCERLSATLQAARPSEELFSAPGEFWARLASRLSQPRAPIWPLAPYVPPVMLGVLGSLTEGLISLLVLLYALSGWGVIPALGKAIAPTLHAALEVPWIEGWLEFSWIAWAREALQRWEGMQSSAQEAVVWGPLLLGLAVVWLAAVSLFLLWALCWSNATRLHHRGGN